MRQLRFLRSADDGVDLIVETTDGAEQFTLRVDAALRDAARSDLPRLLVAEPEPTISPREIQVRVRAGESPQSLAEAHQMTLERVLRFAGPVLEERTRIAAEARRARARRSTTEGQTVIFGDAVDERFSAHGVDASAVRWDARRGENGHWIISAGWRGGDAERIAEWTLNLTTRTVTPLDDTAADLLSDRPIRPIVMPVEVPQRPTLAAAPPLMRGVVSFPVMADARTGPLPGSDEVFDQEAIVAEAPRASVSARNAPGRSAAATTIEADAPELDLGIASLERGGRSQLTNLGVAVRGEPSEEERAARTRIPSWDDILMGVRRKGD